MAVVEKVEMFALTAGCTHLNLLFFSSTKSLFVSHTIQIYFIQCKGIDFANVIRERFD